MVASGTATLEAAILQKPMVVVYKTSLLTWMLAKFFVRVKDIGLVNVVAGRRIVPECVQFQATGEQIAKELKNIFTNEPRIAVIKSHLKRIKASLGLSGASRRAAEEVLKSTP
jgi:lipid-A-disaccharide synthase